MYLLSALLLLSASLAYTQDQQPPPWLRPNAAQPQVKVQAANPLGDSAESLNRPPSSYNSYEYEEKVSPAAGQQASILDNIELLLNDSNQYINPSHFIFTNDSIVGNAATLPPAPPLLTNTNTQDLIDFIRINMKFMEGQAQSNTGMTPKPKPQEERAFLDRRTEYFLPPAAEGLWWRFYSQNTSIYNIPAATEEMLIIAPSTGEAAWIQSIQTAGTVQSKSQRRLQVAMYMIDTGRRGSASPLWFFYYPSKVYSSNPDPSAAQEERLMKQVQSFPITTVQDVAETPAYFVQIFPDQGFMQMSKDPTFPHDRTMFWRRYPREVPGISAPLSRTNEAISRPKPPLPAASENAYEDNLGYINPEEDYAPGDIQ